MMKYISWASGVMLLVAGAQGQQRTAPTPQPKMGMNLTGPADWNTELPFVDVFRMSRPWISQRKGAGWGKGPELEIDELGWVKRLEPDCYAESPLCTIKGGHYPAGRYTVLYEGEGTLDLNNVKQVISRAPGKLVFEPDPSRGGFFLRIMQSNAANYVKNIRVIMPGFEQTWQKDPFHPPFLARWQGLAALRFMDWMHTNNSEIEKWEDRPTPAHATFSKRGVALEWMIDLCNRQKADAWFCMPHKADDGYVRNFAVMVKEKLDPSLKVYVEYSNEVWNGQFAQSKYAGQQGVKLGLGDAKRPWEAGWHYTARRSVEIFKIWEQVMGGRQRLVRVLPSQSANMAVTRGVCEFEKAYMQADALAIAPYISMIVPAQARGRIKITADEVSTWTLDKVLDYVENEELPQSIRFISQQKKMADQYGLKLVCYEAGQHLVGVNGGENNEKMNELFYAANAHPRMGTIYRKYLDAWKKEGGDLICNFSSVSANSKWGSWGLLEFYDSDPAKSPKFMAVMQWAKEMGHPVQLPR